MHFTCLCDKHMEQAHLTQPLVADRFLPCLRVGVLGCIDLQAIYLVRHRQGFVRHLSII
jgi:hypothetical protein